MKFDELLKGTLVCKINDELKEFPDSVILKCSEDKLDIINITNNCLIMNQGSCEIKDIQESIKINSLKELETYMKNNLTNDIYKSRLMQDLFLAGGESDYIINEDLTGEWAPDDFLEFLEAGGKSYSEYIKYQRESDLDYIATLVEDGYLCGNSPQWSIDICSDISNQELDMGYISNSIRNGCISECPEWKLNVSKYSHEY